MFSLGLVFCLGRCGSPYNWHRLIGRRISRIKISLSSLGLLFATSPFKPSALWCIYLVIWVGVNILKTTWSTKNQRSLGRERTGQRWKSRRSKTWSSISSSSLQSPFTWLTRKKWELEQTCQHSSSYSFKCRSCTWSKTLQATGVTDSSISTLSFTRCIKFTMSMILFTLGSMNTFTPFNPLWSAW